MKRHVSNAKPYPIDTPALMPGESTDVEDSPEFQTLIDAGVLVEADEDTASESKRHRHRKSEETK